MGNQDDGHWLPLTDRRHPIRYSRGRYGYLIWTPSGCMSIPGPEALAKMEVEDLRARAARRVTYGS